MTNYPINVNLLDVPIESYEDAERFLMADGDLSVPCSRYGRTTSDCVYAAWAAAFIVCAETGEPMSAADLDHAMFLVVNDHDDPVYLVETYGQEHGFAVDGDGDICSVETATARREYLEAARNGAIPPLD